MLYIGSDHAGFKLKQVLRKYLEKKKIKYSDLGNLKLDPKDDYPDFGSFVSAMVSASPKKHKGILICGSAEGMGMVANKYKGVRAAVVWDVKTAKLSREHNNANVLSLSGWQLNKDKLEKIVSTWLNTKFTGETRHKRRLKKIEKIEKDNLK